REAMPAAVAARGGLGRGDGSPGALLRVAGRVDAAPAIVGGDAGDLLEERGAPKLRERGRGSREDPGGAHATAPAGRARRRSPGEGVDGDDGLGQALPAAAERDGEGAGERPKLDELGDALGRVAAWIFGLARGEALGGRPDLAEQRAVSVHAARTAKLSAGV